MNTTSQEVKLCITVLKNSSQMTSIVLNNDV